MQLPKTEQSYERLPADPEGRQQSLQEVFGEHLVGLLNVAMSQIEELVESPEKRKKLGRVRGSPYEAVANMSEVDRKKALRLVEAALGLHLKCLMALLDHEGAHMMIGPDHFVNYRLILEVLTLSNGQLAEENVINKSALPTLGENFGRWMNRFRWQVRNQGQGGSSYNHQ